MAMDEDQTWIPTLFEWRSSAVAVHVAGSWDGWSQSIRLEKHGQNSHSVVHSLHPGLYTFRYVVDGRYTLSPNLDTVAAADGNLCHTLRVDRLNHVPTMIDWRQSANDVIVYGSWDSFEATRLHNCGDHHSIWMHLKPGHHWFYYCVDGVDMHSPYFSWQASKDGRKYNFLSVEMPLTKPEPYNGCPVAMTLHRKCQSAYIYGSWDNWVQRVPMFHSEDDHYKNMMLHPGGHYFRFIADGEDIVAHDIEVVHDDLGRPYANKVNAVLPTKHFLDGAHSAALIDDLIAMTGQPLSVFVKFNVGSHIGSIDHNAKAYPCTDFGYMLLSLLGFVKQTYVRGFSWGGCFGPNDMAAIDEKHCQIKAEAKLRLTRANIILDSLQLKSYLFQKFLKDGKYPPYFASLFSYLENPPADFDNNPKAKAIFLDLYDNQAASATPPRRMLVLVNMAQFYKQLPKDKRSRFELDFLPLLSAYTSWQKKIGEDELLNSIYRHRKAKKEASNKEPVANTCLGMVNCLRVSFIHGPEHTLVEEQQLLKAYTEFDLIIAHYFVELFAKLIEFIRENMHLHPLIKAVWDFYCGGSPPGHCDM